MYFMSRYILNTGREGEGKRERGDRERQWQRQRMKEKIIFYGMLLW